MPFAALPSNLAARIVRNSPKKRKDKIFAVQYGDGYEQVADAGINPRVDIWQLDFAPLTAALKNDMDVFIALVGASKTFTWTATGESTQKKWRIEADSYSEVPIGKDSGQLTWKVSFTIKQSFEIG